MFFLNKEYYNILSKQKIHDVLAVARNIATFLAKLKASLFFSRQKHNDAAALTKNNTVFFAGRHVIINIFPVTKSC